MEILQNLVAFSEYVSFTAKKMCKEATNVNFMFQFEICGHDEYVNQKFKYEVHLGCYGKTNIELKIDLTWISIEKQLDI